MRISTVALKNFRAFKASPPIRLGPLTTVVGRNDAGKSSILHALDIFFGNQDADVDDFNRSASAGDTIEITLTFGELPEPIQLEDGVDTSLAEEHLLNENGELAVRRVYHRTSPKKPVTTLLVYDYTDQQFRNLCSLNESALNKLGDQHQLSFTKSGAGVTNKGKRATLRQEAQRQQIQMSPAEITPSGNVEKLLSEILPAFDLFRTDWRLSEEEAPFQRGFKDMVAEHIMSEDAREVRGDVEGMVKNFLDEEVAKIYPFLLQHTDEVQCLTARSELKWKEFVSFRIEATDKNGVEVLLGKRGSGLRRLFMVAYFQYLAQKPTKGRAQTNRIYAIEEPETYLHPSAQRTLLDSLLLVSSRSQVLLTSHSPVFAGSTPCDQLILVSRSNGAAQVAQGANLDMADVAEELGVEPSDSLYGYSACVFVESDDDVIFLQEVGAKLKEAGQVPCTFEDKRIGFIPIGGKDNLKWWVSRRALNRVSKKYAVFVDSDCCGPNDKPTDRLLGWRDRCLQEGGKFHITQKREIENYLHPDVIDGYLKKTDHFDDFTDMGTLFGKDVINLISCMSAEQILERDRYMENGEEKHELVEVIEDFVTLAS